MEILGKAHCLFEQSGTFKQEFIKLGIPAEDYDIQNNFGQTDHVVDLFNEIEMAWGGYKSIFESMSYKDIVLAFFPCIYFEVQQQMFFDLSHRSIQAWPLRDKVMTAIDRSQNRARFHELIYKLYCVCNDLGLRLIIENPANGFLVWGQNFPAPSFIDRDRTKRGDYFKKPTAYWFVNCQPTHGYTCQDDKERKRIVEMKKAPVAGLCSEERSMISPDYARNFICDFILGKEQEEYPQLFNPATL